MNFKLKWERIQAIPPHPQFAIIGGVGGALLGNAGLGLALGGAVSSAAGGGLFGGQQQPSGGGNLGNAIGGVASAAGLAGYGPLSQGTIDKASMLADPYQGQRAGAGAQLGTSLGYAQDMSNINRQQFGVVQGVGAMQGAAGQATLNPYVMGMASQEGRMDPRIAATAGGAQMNPTLTALGTNDPSMQFRYQQGLDAAQRGAAAGGFQASGRQMTELEQYGQGFASQEYGNMFNRQLQMQQLQNSMQGQNFGELATAQQLNESSQGQHFGQLATAQQLSSGVQGQNFQQLMAAAGFGTNAQGQSFNQQLGISELLAHMSGASGGNMGQAGAITAGKYGQAQDNLANVIGSLGGTNFSDIGSGLKSLFGGGQSLQSGGGYGSVPGGYVDPTTGQSFNNPSAYTAPAGSGGYIPFEAGFAGSY